MKIDFHVHSNLSYDGTASLSEIAVKAKSLGLDGVVVSDHNKVATYQLQKIDGVWIIPGCEISCKNAHIQAILFDEKFDMSSYSTANMMTIEEAAKMIHACGGLAIIAHPYAHPTAEGWDPEQLFKSRHDTISNQCASLDGPNKDGRNEEDSHKDNNSLNNFLDGCEAANARAWMKDKEANSKAQHLITEINSSKSSEVSSVNTDSQFNGIATVSVFQTGGSDAHLVDEIGNAYTEVDCDDIEGLRDALLAGKCRAVLVRNTKRIYKGKSQLAKGRRTGTAKALLKAYAVYAKCLLLDLFSSQEK